MVQTVDSTLSLDDVAFVEEAFRQPRTLALVKRFTASDATSLPSLLFFLQAAAGEEQLQDDEAAAATIDGLAMGKVLFATSGKHEPLSGRAVWFMKRDPSALLDVGGSGDGVVLYGTVGDPVQSLAAEIAALYAPMLKSGRHWGQTSADERKSCVGSMDGFVNVLQGALKSVRSGVQLRKPAVESAVVTRPTEQLVLDRAVVTAFAETLRDWCGRTEAFIDESAVLYGRWDPDHAGPAAELEFWQRRQQQLAAVTEKMRDPLRRRVITILAAVATRQARVNAQRKLVQQHIAVAQAQGVDFGGGMVARGSARDVATPESMEDVGAGDGGPTDFALATLDLRDPQRGVSVVESSSKRRGTKGGGSGRGGGSSSAAFEYEVRALLRRWRKIDGRLTEARDEARDVIKYLSMLSKVLTPLRSASPKQAMKLLGSVLVNIRTVLQMSRHFNTSQRLTGLLFKLANQLIECGQRHILSTDVSESADNEVEREGARKGTDAQHADRLWRMEPAVLLPRLDDAMRLVHGFEHEYRMSKDTLLSSSGANFIEIDEGAVFVRLMGWARQLETLKDLSMKRRQFELLRAARLEGTTRVLARFDGATAALRGNNHDLLNFEGEGSDAFERDYMLNFDVVVSDLEVTLRSLMEASFTRSKAIAHSLTLLETFELIFDDRAALPRTKGDATFRTDLVASPKRGAAEKGSIRSELHERLQRIFEAYAADLKAIVQEYDARKMAPPSTRNTPEAVCNIAWSRQLLRRATGPMESLQQRGLDTLTAEDDHMAKKTVAKVVKTYNRIARTLITFEMMWFDAWVASVQQRASGCLEATLLVRPSGTHKRRLVYANFDKDILRLVREAKCLSGMDASSVSGGAGRSMSLRMPQVAKQLLARKDTLKGHLDTVEFVAQRQRGLLFACLPQLSSYLCTGVVGTDESTAATGVGPLPAAAASLLVPALAELDQALHKGLRVLTWASPSSNIEAFITEAGAAMDRFEKLSDAVHSIVRNRIEHPIHVMGAQMLVVLPDVAPLPRPEDMDELHEVQSLVAGGDLGLMEPEEFVETTRARVEERAAAMNADSAAIQRAVSELFDLVDTYAEDSLIPASADDNRVAIATQKVVWTHYRELVYQSLLLATLKSLRALKMRVLPPAEDRQPLFKVDVELALPIIRLVPSLDTMQKAVTDAVKSVLQASALVETWSWLEVEEETPPFWVRLGKDTRICAICLSLAGGVARQKIATQQWLEQFEKFAWLWRMDIEITYGNFAQQYPPPTNEDVAKRLAEFKTTEAAVDAVFPLTLVSSLALLTEHLCMQMRHQLRQWNVRFTRELHEAALGSLSDVEYTIQHIESFISAHTHGSSGSPKSKVSKQALFTSQENAADVPPGTECLVLTLKLTTIEMLRTVRDELESFRERQHKVESDELEFVITTYLLLNAHLPAGFIDDIEAERVALVDQRWRDCTRRAALAFDCIRQSRSRFVKKTESGSESSTLTVERLRSRVDFELPLLNRVHPTEATRIVQELTGVRDEVAAEVSSQQSSERMFGLVVTESIALGGITAQLEALTELHRLHRRYTERVADFQEVQWGEVVSSELSSNGLSVEAQGAGGLGPLANLRDMVATEFGELDRLIPTAVDATPTEQTMVLLSATRAARSMLSSMRSLRDAEALLSGLASGVFRRRHWIRLSLLLGASLAPGGGDGRFPVFTSAELLSGLWIFKDSVAIEENGKDDESAGDALAAAAGKEKTSEEKQRAVQREQLAAIAAVALAGADGIANRTQLWAAVDEILQLARREEAVEQQLLGIRTSWATFELPIIIVGGSAESDGTRPDTAAELGEGAGVHEDGSASYVLDVTELANTLQALGESIDILDALQHPGYTSSGGASMAKAPVVDSGAAMHFLSEIPAQVAQLKSTRETLRSWVEVHSLWSKCKGLFLPAPCPAPDTPEVGVTSAAQWGEPSPAAVLAPRAMQMFEHAHHTWDRTMAQAHAIQRIIPACADEIIVSSLPVIHTELEGAAATLQELLDCRRVEYPRFNLVGDAALLQLLSEARKLGARTELPRPDGTADPESLVLSMTRFPRSRSPRASSRRPQTAFAMDLPPVPPTLSQRTMLALDAARKATHASRNLALGSLLSGVDGLQVAPTPLAPVAGQGGPAEGGQIIVAVESSFRSTPAGDDGGGARSSSTEVMKLLTPVPVTGGLETWLPLLEDEVRRTAKRQCAVDVFVGSQSIAHDISAMMESHTTQSALLALRLAFTSDTRAIMRSWRHEDKITEAFMDRPMTASSRPGSRRSRPGTTRSLRPGTSRKQEGVDAFAGTAVSLDDIITTRNAESKDEGDGSNELVLFSGLIEDGLAADEAEAEDEAVYNEASRHERRQNLIFEQLTRLAADKTLSALQHSKNELALTVQIHQRDMMKLMVSSRDASESAWAAQPHFSWYHGGRDSLGHGSCVVSICRASIRHGFHYIGAREMANTRIFLTPLTERCQTALVQSIGRGANGSHASSTIGSALCGEGGQALLTSFAATVGRPVINFDCAAGSHADTRATAASLSRTLRAACAGGLWVNFIEPDRLGSSLCARLAAQLSKIAAVKHNSWADWQLSSRLRGDRATSKTLWGSAVRLDAGSPFPLDVDMAAFITCAHRSSMTSAMSAAAHADALVELHPIFRSISMVRPSLEHTLGTVLLTMGWSRDAVDFKEAVLSCDEILMECAKLRSDRSGTDFGSAAAGTLLLGALIAALRAESKRSEEFASVSACVYTALRCGITPRLLKYDRPAFWTLIDDAFPTSAAAAEESSPRDEGRVKLIKAAASRLGLKATPQFVTSAAALIAASETVGVQVADTGCAGGVPPILLVGPTGCGKTSIVKTVLESLSAMSNSNERYLAEVMYTGAIAPEILMGSGGVGSSEPVAPGSDGSAWDHSVCMDGQQGMLNVVWNKICENEESSALANSTGAATERTWLVCDGPIAPAAADSLCSVLGLGWAGVSGSSTAITMPYNALDRSIIASGTRVLFETSTLENASPQLIARSLIVCVDADALGVDPLIHTWLAAFEHHAASAHDVRKQLKPLLHAYLEEAANAASLILPWARSALNAVSTDAGVHRSRTTLVQRVLPVLKMLSAVLFTSDLSASIEDLAVEVKRILVYSLAWGLGGALPTAGRDQLNAWIGAQDTLHPGMPGAVAEKKKKKSKDKKKAQKHHHHKPTGHIFEYCLNPETIEWQPWTSPFHDMHARMAKQCGSTKKSSKGKKSGDIKFVPYPPPVLRIPPTLPSPPQSFDLLVPTLQSHRALFVAKQMMMLPVPIPPAATGSSVPPLPPSPMPVVLVAPRGCGKTSTAMLLFEEQMYPRRDMITRVTKPYRVALTSGSSGTSLQHRLENTVPGLMRTVGGQAHAGSGRTKPTLLFLDDLNLAEPSALELARQVIETSSLRSVNSRSLGQLRTRTAAGTRILATVTAPSLAGQLHNSHASVQSQIAAGSAHAGPGIEGGLQNGALFTDAGRRTLRHFFAIALEAPKGALEIASIVSPMLEATFGAASAWTSQCAESRGARGLTTNVLAEDMDAVAVSLGVATGVAWEWVVSNMPTAPDRWMCQWSLYEAGQVVRGLLQASSKMSNGAETLTKLWRHECAHVFCDRLRISSERERVFRKLDTIAKKYLDPLISVRGASESDGIAVIIPLPPKQPAGAKKEKDHHSAKSSRSGTPSAGSSRPDTKESARSAKSVPAKKLDVMVLPTRALERPLDARNASVPWVNFARSEKLLDAATLEALNALDSTRAEAALSTSKKKGGASKEQIGSSDRYRPVVGYDVPAETQPVVEFHQRLLALLKKFNEISEHEGSEGAGGALGPLHVSVDVPFAMSVASAARVLNVPGGHLVLVGGRNSGRRAVARLASFCVWGRHTTHCVDVDWGHLSATIFDLRSALRAACRNAAMLGQASTVVLHGALFDHIVSSRQHGAQLRQVLGPVDALIRGHGEIPVGLFTAEELIALHQAIAVEESSAASARRRRIASSRVSALVHIVICATIEDGSGAGLLRQKAGDETNISVSSCAYAEHAWLVNRFFEFPGLAATPLQWIAAPNIAAHSEHIRALITTDEVGKYVAPSAAAATKLAPAAAAAASTALVLAAPGHPMLQSPAVGFVPLPSELQQKLSQFFANIHVDAMEISRSAIAAAGGENRFTSPLTTQTLTWCIEQYRLCFVRRSRWVSMRKSVLCDALRKMLTLEADMVVARAQLAHEQKYAAQSQATMDHMLSDIELASIGANKVRVDVVVKRDWCAAEKKRITVANAECDVVLASAQPFLVEADKAVNVIRPGDLNDLRRLASIPDSFKLHVDTLLILHQMPIDEVAPTTVLLGSGRTKARVKFLANAWDHGGRAMVQDGSFLRNLFHFNEYSRDEINAETIELMEPYLKFRHLEKSGLDNRAAEAIVTWLKAIVEYSRAATKVRPQIERVKSWQNMYEAKQVELAKVEKVLAKADQQVSDLCADANASLRDLTDATANMRALKNRVDNANTVLRGLAGDRARWRTELAQLWTGSTAPAALATVDRLLSGDSSSSLSSKSESGKKKSSESSGGKKATSPTKKKGKKSAKGKKKDAAGASDEVVSVSEKKATTTAAERDPLGAFINKFEAWLVPGLLEIADANAATADDESASKSADAEVKTEEGSDRRANLCVARVASVGDAAAAAIYLSYGGTLPAHARRRLLKCTHMRLAQLGVPFTAKLSKAPERLLLSMFGQDAGVTIAGWEEGAAAHMLGVTASDVECAERAEAAKKLRFAAAATGGATSTHTDESYADLRLGLEDTKPDASGTQPRALMQISSKRWSRFATGIHDGLGECAVDVESAAIAVCSARPPLLIDPEGRALAWLRRTGGRCAGAKGASVGGVESESGAPTKVEVILASEYDPKLQSHLEAAITSGSTLIIMIGANAKGDGERMDQPRPLLPTATQIDQDRAWGVSWGAHHSVRDALRTPFVGAVVGNDPALSHGTARRQGTIGGGGVNPMLLAALRHAMKRNRGGTESRNVRLEGNLSVECNPHFRLYLVSESQHPSIPDAFLSLVNVIDMTRDNSSGKELMLQRACTDAFPWIEEERRVAARAIALEVNQFSLNEESALLSVIKHAHQLLLPEDRIHVHHSKSSSEDGASSSGGKKGKAKKNVGIKAKKLGAKKVDTTQTQTQINAEQERLLKATHSSGVALIGAVGELRNTRANAAAAADALISAEATPQRRSLASLAARASALFRAMEDASHFATTCEERFEPRSDVIHRYISTTVSYAKYAAKPPLVLGADGKPKGEDLGGLDPVIARLRKRVDAETACSALTSAVHTHMARALCERECLPFEMMCMLRVIEAAMGGDLDAVATRPFDRATFTGGIVHNHQSLSALNGTDVVCVLLEATELNLAALKPTPNRAQLKGRVATLIQRSAFFRSFNEGEMDSWSSYLTTLGDDSDTLLPEALQLRLRELLPLELQVSAIELVAESDEAKGELLRAEATRSLYAGIPGLLHLLLVRCCRPDRFASATREWIRRTNQMPSAASDEIDRLGTRTRAEWEELVIEHNSSRTTIDEAGVKPAAAPFVEPIMLRVDECVQHRALRVRGAVQEMSSRVALLVVLSASAASGGGPDPTAPVVAEISDVARRDFSGVLNSELSGSGGNTSARLCTATPNVENALSRLKRRLRAAEDEEGSGATMRATIGESLEQGNSPPPLVATVALDGGAAQRRAAVRAVLEALQGARQNAAAVAAAQEVSAWGVRFEPSQSTSPSHRAAGTGTGTRGSAAVDATRRLTVEREVLLRRDSPTWVVVTQCHLDPHAARQVALIMADEAVADAGDLPACMQFRLFFTWSDVREESGRMLPLHHQRAPTEVLSRSIRVAWEVPTTTNLSAASSPSTSSAQAGISNARSLVRALRLAFPKIAAQSGASVPSGSGGIAWEGTAGAEQAEACVDKLLASYDSPSLTHNAAFRSIVLSLRSLKGALVALPAARLKADGKKSGKGSRGGSRGGAASRAGSSRGRTPTSRASSRGSVAQAELEPVAAAAAAVVEEEVNAAEAKEDAAAPEAAAATKSGVETEELPAEGEAAAMTDAEPNPNEAGAVVEESKVEEVAAAVEEEEKTEEDEKIAIPIPTPTPSSAQAKTSSKGVHAAAPSKELSAAARPGPGLWLLANEIVAGRVPTSWVISVAHQESEGHADLTSELRAAAAMGVDEWLESAALRAAKKTY